MGKTRILLTAFRNTSAELLIKDSQDCGILLLPNDLIRDSELLRSTIAEQQVDCVISLGQKPNIKNKIYIETTGKKKNFSMLTAFDCEELVRKCREKGFNVRLSHNAGTSFCNELYYNGLQYIQDNELDVRMVFIHVPFWHNISNPEEFGNRLQDVIFSLREGL